VKVERITQHKRSPWSQVAGWWLAAALGLIPAGALAEATPSARNSIVI
jgi:hypothetical protein